MFMQAIVITRRNLIENAVHAHKVSRYSNKFDPMGSQARSDRMANKHNNHDAMFELRGAREANASEHKMDEFCTGAPRHAFRPMAKLGARTKGSVAPSNVTFPGLCPFRPVKSHVVAQRPRLLGLHRSPSSRPPANAQRNRRETHAVCDVIQESPMQHRLSSLSNTAKLQAPGRAAPSGVLGGAITEAALLGQRPDYPEHPRHTRPQPEPGSTPH